MSETATAFKQAAYKSASTFDATDLASCDVASVKVSPYAEFRFKSVIFGVLSWFVNLSVNY